MSKNNSSFGKLNILKILAKGEGRVVFLGAGGVGMSSLMALTSHFGIHTFGVDRNENEYVRMLREKGEDITVGECKIPSDTVLIVYTLALSEEDPNLRLAECRNIPCVSRAEYMSAIASAYKTKIAVSGSHGKSTVTAMLHYIFKKAGKNPTTLCGAPLSKEGEAYSIGSLDYFIYEACEYKDSFLAFEPDIALFLNLEYDHTDYFKTFDALCESFLSAAQKCGCAVMNTDDEKLREIAKKIDTPPVLVGEYEEKGYNFKVVSDAPHALAATVLCTGRELGVLKLDMLGRFNISNAVMAVVAAMRCGIPFDVCKSALSTFRGIPSRLEYIGEWNGRKVYFDYAHHPTEIENGIKALKRDTGDDLTLIFGPHTYSRTSDLFDSFASALSHADHLFLTPIDAVREKIDTSISSESLACVCGGNVVYTKEDVTHALSKTKGTIAVMGAADLSWVKSIFL